MYQRIWLIASLAVALVVGLQPVQAGVSSGKANSVTSSGVRYTICRPAKNPLGYARANPRYPFTFLLSTKYEDTVDYRIRRAVRSIQGLLRTIGVRDQFGGQVVVDGRYGPQTAAAVRRFQRKHHLLVDGTVGPQTWRRLSEKCWYYH